MSRVASEANTNLPNIREVLLETHAANDRMSQLIFDHLDAHAWRAKRPA